MKRIISEKILFSGSKYIKQKEYWVNKLSCDIAKTDIVLDMKKNLTHTHPAEMAVLEIVFPDNLCRQIMNLSNQTDLTIYIILLAALKALIYRYTGNKDITVISPVYKLKISRDLINDFLFIRDTIDEGSTFKELLLQLKDTVIQAYENQDYPSDKLVEYLFAKPGTRHNGDISNIECSLQNIHGEGQIKNREDAVVFCFRREGQKVSGDIIFDPGTYETDYIQQISRHFLGILENTMKDVNTGIARVSFLSHQDKMRLLFDFNNNNADFPKDRTVYSFIEAQAEKNPRRTAIAFEEMNITYEALNQGANQLAGKLQTHGIGTDQTVGIMLDRSPRVVVSILAVWKAGGAYIPIDSTYPATRITGILEDSGTKALITTHRYVEVNLEKNTKAKIITVDKQMMDPGSAPHSTDLTNPGSKINMGSLAYVIYTSGSTGKPKGAMVEHLGMMNHLQAKINDLQLTESSVVVQNASITFDISVWQFYAALITGGKIIIYPDELILEPDRFMTRLLSHRVTILEVVPSYLAILLEAGTLHPLPLLPALEYLVVTGEEIKPQLVKKWFDTYPGSKIVNAYGPTEASDDITHFIIDRAPDEDCPRIPIGRPIQNMAIYIVDENMKLCPVEVKGEIWVSGVGVGRGYLNNPELSAERFIMNMPEMSNMSHMSYKSSIIYKTGDLGRWLPNGTIEFFGRKDYQVKIRGYRIELGEIESKLMAHPEVKEAVVIERTDSKANPSICAYLVPAADTWMILSSVKDYLAELLPGYMIPAYFVKLDELPLTPNGKIDRKALPEPDHGAGTMIYITGKMLEDLKETVSKTFMKPTGKEIDRISAGIIEIIETENAVLQNYRERTAVHCYPLTHSQKMIYYSEKKYWGTSCGSLIYTIKYPWILDKKLLERAINMVLLKNDSFRLRMIEVEQGDESNAAIVPAQYAADYKEQTLDSFAFSGKDGEKRLQEWLDIYTRKPFAFIDSDLFYFAYIKFNERESGYYVNLHHIVSDGWTGVLMTAEIEKIYEALKAGEAIDESANPSYLSYVPEEISYLKSPQAKENIEFWHGYLLPLPAAVSLSPAKIAPYNLEGGVSTFVVPSHLRTRMHEYCQRHNTSIFKLVLAALSIYVKLVTGVDDFVIGTLNHNRSQERYQKIAGTFIRFIPIRIKIHADSEFHHFVKEIGQNVKGILKNHQKYPFDLLINQLRERTGIDPGYFYNINLVDHPNKKGKKFKFQHHFPIYEPTQLTIHINFNTRDIEGILELEWNYQAAWFLPSHILRIYHGLIAVLEDALGHPDRKLSKIQPLIGKERQQAMGAVTIDTGKIEDCLLKHPAVTGVAVLRKTAGENTPGKGTGNRWHAYLAARDILKEAELKEYLSSRLPPGMIPSSFVQLEKMPLTRNGKLNRNLLAALEIEKYREHGYQPPDNEVENKLAELWQEVLGIEKHRISMKANFFQLGGHSLIAVILAAKIHKEFNVRLPLVEVFNTPTVRGLAEFITNAAKSKFDAINPVEKKEYYALSSAQKRLYVLQQVDLQSTAYNLPQVIPLADDADLEKIKRTFIQLINRHESLRTSMHMIAEEAVQRIHENFNFEIHYYDLAADKENHKLKIINKVEPFGQILDASGGREGEPATFLINSFIRPFDLSNAPLLQVGVLKKTEPGYLLLVDMHHIISDGVSHGILLKDFNALYDDETLSPLRIQYKDFSGWQNRKIKKEALRRQETYWLEEFAGEIPVLNLPADYSAQGAISFEGDAVRFELSRRLTDKVKKMIRETDTTVNIFLLAVYNILLSKYTGQEDIIVGNVIAGRPHADQENIIGFFVNMLAMRNQPTAAKTFKQFLGDVKKTAVNAYENQDYPFEELVAKLDIQRSPGRHPLIDTVFSFHGTDELPKKTNSEITPPSTPARDYRFEAKISHFDLLLHALPFNGRVNMTFEYSTRLFKRAFIEKIAHHYTEILEQVTENPGIRLNNLKISHQAAAATLNLLEQDQEGFDF